MGKRKRERKDRVEKWYGLSLVFEINPEDHYEVILNELYKIFGRKCPFFIPGDFLVKDKYFESFSEGYLFVFCSIDNFESKIKRSNVFFSCKDGENDNYLVSSSDELVRMQLEFESKYRFFFNPGDLVFVKKGLMSGLHGMILNKNGGSKYSVYFKTFSREMLGSIESQNLTFVRSAFIFSKVERYPLVRTPFVRFPKVRIPLQRVPLVG